MSPVLLPAMMFAYCRVAEGSSRLTTACIAPDLPDNGAAAIPVRNVKKPEKSWALSCLDNTF